MTLDDIERIAKAWQSAEMGDVQQMARALLAVMPVVRAAESWHAVNTGQHTNGPQHMLAMRDTRKALVDAVETMRAEIGRGGK